MDINTLEECLTNLPKLHDADTEEAEFWQLPLPLEKRSSWTIGPVEGVVENDIMSLYVFTAASAEELGLIQDGRMLGWPKADNVLTAMDNLGLITEAAVDVDVSIALPAGSILQVQREYDNPSLDGAVVSEHGVVIGTSNTSKCLLVDAASAPYLRLPSSAIRQINNDIVKLVKNDDQHIVVNVTPSCVEYKVQKGFNLNKLIKLLRVPFETSVDNVLIYNDDTVYPVKHVDEIVGGDVVSRVTLHRNRRWSHYIKYLVNADGFNDEIRITLGNGVEDVIAFPNGMHAVLSDSLGYTDGGTLGAITSRRRVLVNMSGHDIEVENVHTVASFKEVADSDEFVGVVISDKLTPENLRILIDAQELNFQAYFMTTNTLGKRLAPVEELLDTAPAYDYPRSRR